MSGRKLHWFRRDLRVRDNGALGAACEAAGDGVVGLYVICPEEWEAHDEAAVKVEFWLRNLVELKRSLGELNIPLIVRRVRSWKRGEGVARAVAEVAKESGCDGVYFGREHEVDERRRDEAAIRACEAKGITAHPVDDRAIVPAGEVVTKSGGFYTVFTPFKNRWLEVLEERGWEVGGTPRKQKGIDVEASEIPVSVGGFESGVDPELWPAGEDHAAGRLGGFVRDRIGAYGERRDLPAENGTSTLSPYLAAGVISARACLRSAIEHDGGKLRLGKRWKGKESGAGSWINELVWRDFYIHLTHNFPRVSMGRDFKGQYASVRWRRDEGDFARWCEGRTGVPIVDAAMRQLNATGWMHNRCRMIAAMFLTKHLLIDWRWGERYFMQRLIDGDLASNNGGWQWSASTGTDAAPYFRVYNPYRQAERFDPEGAYIARWVPELAGVEGGVAVDPRGMSGSALERVGYPPAIVDHGAARERVLRVFKAALDRAS